MIGRVYKIITNQNEECYIGSTIDTLNSRFSKHKYDSKKLKRPCFSKILFDKYGIDNCRIELIKEYKVIDKQHLKVYECLWFNKIKNKVNNIPPFAIRKLTIKYYNNTHKKQIKEWNEKNKEELSKKQFLRRQKQRKEICEKQKIYAEKNKEKIQKKNKEKITCECGSVISRYCKSQHLKSKKHNDLLQKMS